MRFNKEGMRMTDCCGACSTFSEGLLCCKACYQPVGFGEGDGSECRPPQPANKADDRVRHKLTKGGNR
jgi:hypothetical protein